MAKADDILKKYGITQVTGSETGTGSAKADKILAKYGVTQVRPSSFGTVQEWVDAGSSLISEVQKSYSNWRKQNDYEQRELQSKIGSYISQSESWRSMYADNEEAVSAIDSLVSALSKASDFAHNNYKYFSQWDTEYDYQRGSAGWLYDDAETNVDTVARRKAIYQSNADRIAEIKSQLPWYGDTFLPSGVESWLLSGDNKKLKEELDTLIAENNKYDRTQGVTDKYYVPVTDEFTKNASFRDYKNASREELWTYDMSASEGSTALSNGGSYDEYGNIVDAKGRIVQYANGPAVEDKLGLFLSATDADITEAYGILSASNGNYTDTWANLMQEGDVNAWKYLTDYEVQIYYDLYKREGQEAAYQYLADMTTELTRRETQATTDYINSTSALEQIAWNAASIPMNVFGGLTSLVDDAAHILQGEEINPYSRAHSFQNAASDIRTKTATDINEATGNAALPWVGTTFGDVYQFLMSSADSAVGSAIGGTAYGVLMGMGASSSEMKRLYEQGASMGQIAGGGILAGAAEMVFEKYSIDKLVSMGDSKTIRAAVINALKQGGVEASEEIFTEIANTITNVIVMGSQSDWVDVETFAKNVVNAGIGGFISGGAIGGAGSAISYGQYAQQTKQNGKAIINAGGVDVLRDLANEVAGASFKTDSKVTPRNVGRMYNAVATAYDTQNQADIAKSLERKGYSTQEANAIAGAIVAEANNQSLTEKQAKILKQAKGDSRVQTAISDIVSNNRYTMGQRDQVLQDFVNGVNTTNAIRAYAKAQYKAKNKSKGNLTTAEENAPESHYEVSADGRTIDSEGNIISISGISAIEKGRLVLKTEDGKTIDSGSILFGSNGEAMVYDAVARLEGIIDTDTADRLSKHLMKLGDATSEWYVNGIVQAYTYGYYGYGREALTGKDTLSATLSEKQRNVAYGLGEKYRDAKTTADQAKAKTAAVAKNATASDKTATTAPDGTKYKSVRFESKVNNWGKKQQSEVAFIDFIASNFSGNTVHIYESYVENGRYVYVDSNGNVHSAPNGMYITSTGDIYLDLNAGTHGEGLIMNTFAHELYHHIQKQSPAKARALAEFLVKELGYESVEEAVDRQIDKAERAGHGVEYLMETEGLSRNAAERMVYDRAFSDFVADSLETMFTKGDAVGKLRKLKSQDEGLFYMIKRFVKNWVKKLREFTKTHSHISIEGGIVAQLDKFDHIQQMFVEALVDAGENYQASITASESETLTEAGIGFDEDTKSVYSLRYSTAYQDVIQVGKKSFDTEAIAQIVAKGTGRSIDDSRKWVKSEMAIANIVMANPEFLDFEADNRYEAIKKNSDYPQGTVDLSNLCPKREEFTAMFDKLQKKYPNKLFTAQDIADMRKILAKNHITVACGACFVEDRRQLIGEIADTFIGMWKEAAETGKPLQKTNAAGKKIELLVTKALAKQYGLTSGSKIMATDTYIPNQYDLTTYEGFKLLEKNHPTIAMAFNRYNNSRGQQSARLIEGRAEYNRQILGWTENKVKTVNNNGGLRIFSFSDFEVVHLLDLVQVIIDCSARGVKIQGYTKIPAFARLVRNTGIKLNRSLIPKGDYGFHMENGKVVLDYDNTEGINRDDENFLDESDNPNVGNVLIGINPTQISAAFLDPFVDYIIPFHSNKAKAILKKLGTGEWVNYKESQHEKDISTGTASKHNVNIYTQVINKYHPTNKVEFVDAFLKECKRQGKIPRYAEFLNVDENGDYAYREGYHKLLVDFKMFDKDGNILPQGNIAPNMDEAFMKELLESEVDRKQSYQFPQAVYDDIDKQFGEQVLHSDRDNAPTFYSHMAKVVDGVKQEKLGASSVVSMLRGKGVKAEEIKWSGIEEWLEGKKSVTKAELQEFIAGSMLQIDEETLTNDEIPYTDDQQKRITEHTAKRDEIAQELAEAWKQVTGDEIPITNFGAGLESSVESKIRDVNLEHKKASFEGRLLEKLRKDIKEVIANNDDFGFDSWKEALISIHRHRKSFIDHYELSTADKAVIVKYCNALNAYNELPNKINDHDTTRLRSIAHEAELYNRKIGDVKSEHYAENAKHMTKWGEYKLKGGTNYRELLFKIPGSSYYNDAMAMHWDERSGVLAHARIQDLNTFLGEMLFVEEIQSDWHNEGHKEGYRTATDKELEELEAQKKKLLAEKDAIMEEHEAFLTRYWEENLSEDEYTKEQESYFKKIREINAAGRKVIDKLNDLRLGVPNAPFKDTYHEYVLKRLLREAAEKDYDSIGWTPAEIQVKRWSKEFAEGYRIEYDQDIPKFLNKYGKKWGTKVGKTVLDSGTEVWSMAITDEMKESVLNEGQPLYSERIDTSDMDVKAKKIISNLETRARFSRFSKGEYASYSTERIERELSRSSATKMDYAKSYIAWVNPDDFLYATTTSQTGRDQIEKEAGTLDLERLREQTQPIHLTVDFETGKIVGHEGRHRMTALRNAGVEKVAVIFDAWNDDRHNTKPVSMMRIGGQEFDRYHGGLDFYVHDMLPLSRRYADAVRKLFSEVGGSVKFSERDTESVSNRSLLANAFESVAQNDIERNKIQEYKSKIDLINADERKLSELNQKIKDLSFSKGPRDTQAIRDLQFEAKQTANRINTYDKQLLRLEASKPLQAVLDREKKRAYQRAMDRGRESLEKYRDRAKASEIRAKIRFFKSKLERSLLNPTDRQYVPIDLIKAMVDVCGLIDMDTELYKADGSINKAQEKRNLTKEKLQNLRDEYEKLKTHSDPIYEGEFDGQVYAYLTELRDDYAGKNLNEMSLDELMGMYEILCSIEETLQDARKLIGWGDAEGVYEVGDAVVAEQNAITKSRKGGKRNAAQIRRDNSLNNSLAPVRNVERMSGYNQDSALLKLFKKFEQGIRKKNKFVMDAYKSFENLTSGKEYEDAIYNEVGGKKYTDVKGRKFGVSKMQMMQAVLSWERESANDKLHHIESGGFTFADVDLLCKGELKKAISAEHSHRVPAATNLVAEFNEILKGDKWCQDYMAEARKFFNGTAKDAINETSIALKHRIIAKDKSYIPFEVDEMFIVREISAANDVQQTINSYGMLKDTKNNAPQALIITGLNNVLDRHIDMVGNVYGLAIEVRNFNKVWNVRSLDSVGNDPTVKEIIETNWGAEGRKHIEQAVQDIQGARIRERSPLYDKIKSGYISATFLLNLSVVTKQIGSLYSATSMLKWRSPVRMVGNLLYTMAKHKKISAEVDKYTATAWMRRQGMSDAELHTFMTEGKKSLFGKLAGKLPAAFNPGKWITAMDSAVALSLWRYAKIDTAKRTGLKGEELLKATAEFYDDVVENTQSMTDVLHRPEIQKKGGILAESVAMFKTDLYQMAGQLHVTAGRFNANKTKENGIALGRTLSAVLMSAVWGQLMTTVFALIRYKVNHYRDDEDEELTAESWLKRQGFSFAGDLMGYIFPIFGSEAVGIIETIMYGESEDIVDNIVLDLVNDLYGSMTSIASDLKEGETPKPADMKNLVVKALQCFGVPASNILRTVEAIHLHAKDIANGEFLSFEAGVERSPKHHIHRIMEAIDAGNTDVAIGLYEEAIEETAMDKAENKKKDAYGNEELKEAKADLKSALGDKYKDGEISSDLAIRVLVKCFDMDKDEAKQTIGKWDFKLKYGYAWTDRGDAYLDGKISARDLKKLIVDIEGKTAEEAEEYIEDLDFRDRYGFDYSDRDDAYKSGEISASQLRTILMDNGMTREDADLQIEAYDWEAQGFDGVTKAAVRDYNEYCDAYGVPKDVYLYIRKFSNNTENEVDEVTGKTIYYSAMKRVMAEINAQHITADQKYAIARSLGWSEKNIQKYKTW